MHETAAVAAVCGYKAGAEHVKGTRKTRATQKQDCRKKWATQGQRFRALPLRCPGQRFRALPLRCPAAAGQRMGSARAAQL